MASNSNSKAKKSTKSTTSKRAQSSGKKDKVLEKKETLHLEKAVKKKETALAKDKKSFLSDTTNITSATAKTKKQSSAVEDSASNKLKTDKSSISDAVASKKEKTPSSEKKKNKRPSTKKENSKNVKLSPAEKTSEIGDSYSDSREIPLLLKEKIGQLIKIYQENKYLSYDDIIDALPDGTPDELDLVSSELHKRGIELEVSEPLNEKNDQDLEDEKLKADQDILDDPVRMYLKQMGQVPLLNRDQEVDISKRIEDAETEVREIIYNMGFTAKEHVTRAEKLIAEVPKERFDRIVQLQENSFSSVDIGSNVNDALSDESSFEQIVQDQKLESRDTYIKTLKGLIKKVLEQDDKVEKCYENLASYKESKESKRYSALLKEFNDAHAKLKKMLPKFQFKQKVIDEISQTVSNIHEKFLAARKVLAPLENKNSTVINSALIKAKQKEISDTDLSIKEADLKIKKVEQQLAGEVVKSTLDGTVKKVGDPAKGEVDGEPFIVVESAAGAYIQGMVGEYQLDSVKPGQVVTGMAYESQMGFQAEITEVSPYPQEGYSSGMQEQSYYPFTAVIQDGQGFKANEMVSMDLPAEGGEITGIFISREYIRTQNGEEFVYKEGEDQRLKKQKVTTGRTFYGSTVEIKEGITLEDKLAFPYGKNVREGAGVREASIEELYSMY